MPRLLGNGSTNPQLPRLIIAHNDDIWSEILWSAMAWMLFLFNLAVGVSFIKDVFILEHYDYAKHMTTVITMCVSYFSAAWIHRNIIKNHGRVE